MVLRGQREKPNLPKHYVGTQIMLFKFRYTGRRIYNTLKNRLLLEIGNDDKKH